MGLMSLDAVPRGSVIYYVETVPGDMHFRS